MTNAADAPLLQIQLYEDLYQLQNFFPTLAQTVIDRLGRHIWYASPEMTPFALTSDLTSVVQKKSLAKAILEAAKGYQPKRGVIAMAPYVRGSSLSSRITDQSAHFFCLFRGRIKLAERASGGLDKYSRLLKICQFYS